MDYTKFDEYIGKELYQARVKKKLTQDKITKLINYELITTSKRLGHSSISTTIENYIHVLDDEGKTVINMIDKIKNTH